MLDIILPCYKSDAVHLDMALRSIQVQRTYYQYTAWLVNDGGGDDITRAAELHGVNHVRLLCNGGLPGALNVGHRVGSAKYICWTSDDNLLAPDFVQSMVSAAESGPFDFVRSLERHIPGGEICDPRHGNSALPIAGKYDGYLGASHIYTRELYNRTKGYDPEMAGAEDLDYYWQMMDLSPRIGFVNRVLYNYRDGSSRFPVSYVESARQKIITKWRLA